MQKTREEREPVKELERVFVIPTRPGEELHGTVVEIDGEVRGDLRYHSEGKKVKGMIRRRRGIMVLLKKYKEFTQGVLDLGKALTKYEKTEQKKAA